MEDDLSIRTERDGRTSIVAADGEIDISSVGDLRTAVTDAAVDCDRLRLDLTDVDFIDSTGLGCLLELRSTLNAREVALEIVAGEGPVRQAVEITGLGELLAR
ncbi:MAG TPA: STAS domain-containing protein [Solirubrobacter sp.]|nr:STAS domain-containing protein [Solirubrobacter sp.]